MIRIQAKDGLLGEPWAITKANRVLSRSNLGAIWMSLKEMIEATSQSLPGRYCVADFRFSQEWDSNQRNPGSMFIPRSYCRRQVAVLASFKYMAAISLCHVHTVLLGAASRASTAKIRPLVQCAHF